MPSSFNPERDPEIIVRGTRPRVGLPPVPTVGGPGIIPEGPSVEPPSDRDIPIPPCSSVPPDTGFVPTVSPAPVQEIVVRASRPSFGARVAGALPKFNAAAFFATVGGYLVSAILRERSQAQLDEAGRRATETVRRSRRDSPLYPLVDRPMSEIVVTARRPRLLRYVPLPQPLITPDADPFVLIPIVPRVMPQPAASPQVEIAPPVFPSPQRSPLSVPFRFPATFPQRLPSIRPSRRPSIQPGTAPQVAPATAPLSSPVPSVAPSVRPSIRPAVAPQVAQNPLTALRRRLLQSESTAFRTERRSAVEGQVAAAQQGCPPPPQCKKDEELEEMRDRCFKQLVKQGLYPSLDRSYDWEEIDCITGRPI